MHTFRKYRFVRGETFFRGNKNKISRVSLASRCDFEMVQVHLQRRCGAFGSRVTLRKALAVRYVIVVKSVRPIQVRVEVPIW